MSIAGSVFEKITPGYLLFFDRFVYLDMKLKCVKVSSIECSAKMKDFLKFISLEGGEIRIWLIYFRTGSYFCLLLE